MIYITSDFHFYHRNVISYCNRPYDFEQMNDKIVENYNSVIKPGDTCYILGDLMFSWEQSESGLEALIRKLNGRKYLCIGKHDLLTREQYLNMGFYDVRQWYSLSNGIYVCYWPFFQNEYSHEKEQDLITNRSLHELEEYERKNNIPITPKDWLNFNNIRILYHGHIHEKNPKNIKQDNILRINCCIDYKNTKFKPIKYGIHEQILNNNLNY